MNKQSFIKNVSELLRENGVKKPISIPKQVFHISDNEGNSKDFTVKRINKSVLYTVDDISAILDACVCVVQEALKHGEQVNIRGFGTLGLHYRKPRLSKCVQTHEDITVEGRFVPKFSFGDDLRMCAKIYELSLGDRLPEPEPVYDETDGVFQEGGE